MIATPVVFVDIDTQRDFLEPDGALFVAGSDEIAANLARLTTFARERGIHVLATACAHTLDEADPEPFPPHCLIGTRGQERVEATAWPGGVVVGPDDRFDGDLPMHLTIQKRRYDVFSHPDADRVVSRYAESRPTFVVYGVATDYCVKAAALGLLERGQKVVLIVDAIRAVDPSAEADVLGELIRRGATMTLTEYVCPT